VARAKCQPEKIIDLTLEPIRITRSIAPDRQASELTSGVNSGPAAKPDACVVGQKRSQRGENHACEHFWPAALASNSAIGGQVFAWPHNDPVIRISSYTKL